MITKQQQLGWLANNLEKWKSGYDYAVVEKTTDGHLYVRRPSVCTSGITKKEWQQERDKMKAKLEVDNSWHERGEFPPAGTVCEVHEDEWVETFIIGMDKEGYCVYTTGNQYVGYDGENDPSSFRPIRTEREKAIDVACKAISDVIGGRLVVERLYDAGLLK